MSDEPQLSRAKRVAFGATILILTATVIAAALWFFDRYTAAPGGLTVGEVRLPEGSAGTVRELIKAYRQNETLGLLVAPRNRRGTSRAYYDSGSALEKLDRIVFAIPNVPTPFVGSGPRPGVSNNARINALQFRDDREFSLPKPPGVYRIFLTGGSVAFGSAAPSQERTVGAYLERLLNEDAAPSGQRYEVWTLANPAWTSTHERILIANRLSELEPDLVLSISGTNDVHWALFGRNVLWFRTYKDEFFWDLSNVAYRSAGLAPMPDIVRVESEPVAPALVGERLAKNVRLAAFALALTGVPYVYALQPNLHVTGKALSRRERRLVGMIGKYGQRCYDEIRRRLEDIESENLRVVDLSTVFDPLGEDQEIFIDSYHFGDRGNEVLARRLVERLREIL
jgi:hypothetical protein